MRPRRRPALSPMEWLRLGGPSPATPTARELWPRFSFSCAIAGPTPAGRPDVYAPLTGTTVHAPLRRTATRSPWAGRRPGRRCRARRAMWAGRRDRSHDRPRPASSRWWCDDPITRSRSMPSAMEPDKTGNAWLDPSSGVLRLMMATQSPYEVATRHRLDGRGPRASRPKSVDLSIGYNTVGYGTKDHSIFPYLSVIAALYGRGPSGASGQRPLRAVPDGYQAARLLDRCDAGRGSRERGASSASMKGAYRTDGGGRRNLSPEVGMVGAASAQSIYGDLPKQRPLGRGPGLGARSMPGSTPQLRHGGRP